MKKRDKIYDSPEYKQIKEHLPEILKELERDKGLSQYQIPEEWNGDFERIYQKERRKEHDALNARHFANLRARQQARRHLRRRLRQAFRSPR